MWHFCNTTVGATGSNMQEEKERRGKCESPGTNDKIIGTAMIGWVPQHVGASAHERVSVDS